MFAGWQNTAIFFLSVFTYERKEKRKKDAHSPACQGKTKQGGFPPRVFPFVFLDGSTVTCASFHLFHPWWFHYTDKSRKMQAK